MQRVSLNEGTQRHGACSTSPSLFCKLFYRQLSAVADPPSYRMAVLYSPLSRRIVTILAHKLQRLSKDD
ncbi:hypothetical protein DK37_25850 [Halomonas sp. SUBG004]|nr:hypothetical protein DK37_25850 [Halomonas sp. SUBG004]